MDDFDPYYQWLAIPEDVRPPNHYQLLGLQMFEANALVIENAADARMRHLSSYAIGPHAAISQRLMTEISAARVCLCDEARKAAYDEGLCIVPENVKVRPLPSVAYLPDPDEVKKSQLEQPPANTVTNQAAQAFPQVRPMPSVEDFSRPAESEKIAIQTRLDSRYRTKNGISPLLLAGLIVCSLVVLGAVLGLLLP